MAAQRRPRGGRITAVWAGMGVTLLAVVVLALSYVALTQNRSVPDARATPTAVTAPVETPAPAESQPAAAPAAAKIPVPVRTISALDAEVAVRAVATSCPAPSTIETTTDGGVTWQPLAVDGVSAVQRITVAADAFVSLIGVAAEGCVPSYLRSYTGGEAWELASGELAASWFVDPVDRAVIHSPSAVAPGPCVAAVQVTVVDESSAALLCEDSTVHSTLDGGATWLPAVTVPGAAAIASQTGGYRIAIANQNGCVGVQLVPLAPVNDALVPGAPGACLATSVGPGEVAVAGSDESVWVWAGDTLGRSADGGSTWL